jgi:uroporphyrinogen decarboxylase
MINLSSTGKPLLDVLNGRKAERRPVWLMRQAGRYLPEYRDVRAKAGSFLGLCFAPALAAEVTLQPLRRFDLDAAILFSDILVVPQVMGTRVTFVENEGPRLERVSDSQAVRGLRTENAARELGSVYETVNRVCSLLDKRVALIGFCGGAWTVASYMVEGQGSDRRNALAACGEAWFRDLLSKIVEVSVDYLCHQVEAGAEALQIFDSWAGDVPRSLRDDIVLEPSRRIIEGVRQRHADVPIILFGRGLGEAHAAAAAICRPNCIGVEQGVSLGKIHAALDGNVAVQGNLDPAALLAEDGAFRRSVADVLKDAPAGGHIFNLGHGIQPGVAPERVAELVKLIREHDGV